VLAGQAAHQHRQRLDQRGGGLVAPLLGEPGVAGQVQKAHRRDPLGAGAGADLPQRRLDVLDLVLDPGQLLLAVVDGHDRPVQQRRELGVEPGGQLQGLLLTHAGLQHRQLDAGVVGLALGLGGQAQAIGPGPADPGHPDQVQDAGGRHPLQQRHHLQLVGPHRVVRS
jgi:hypothetical protein